MALFRRLFRLPWRTTAQVHDDVDAELRFHLDELGQDVRFGWRALRRRPGFLAVVVLTLALGVTVAGAAVGLLGAFAVTRLLGGLLYEVAPTDPLIFATVPLVLVGVAVLASLVPARRAGRVNPIEALRRE